MPSQGALPTGAVPAAGLAGGSAAAGSAATAVAHGFHAATGQVSSSQLLQFVVGRVWHSSNPQLHTARRALAAHLVQQANPVLDDRPANTDTADYVITSPRAGQVMLTALKARFGDDVQRCYKGMASALSGDLYLSCFMSGYSEQSVQLDLHKLLADAASSSNQPSLQQQRQQQDNPTDLSYSALNEPQAADITDSNLTGTAASSTSIGLHPGSTSAALPAAADLQGQLPTAAAAAGAEPAVGSSARPAHPAASASSAHAVAPVEGGVSPTVSKGPPGFPPWLGLIQPRPQTQPQQQPNPNPGHEQLVLQQQPSQDEQQVPQLSVSANGASPRHTGSLPAALSPQHDLPAAAAAAATGAAALEQQPAVPLVYELQLTHAAPGWYTATYLPYQPQSGDAAIDNSSSNRALTPAAAGSASSSAVADGLQQGSTGAGGAVRQKHGAAAHAEYLADAADGAAGADAADGTAGADGVADRAGQVVADKAAAAAAEAPAGDLSDEEPVTAAGGTTQDGGVDVQQGHEPDDVVSGDTDAPPQSAGNAAAAAAAAAPGCQEVDPGLTALLQAIPARLHQELLPYLSGSSPSQPALTHILIDRHHPVTLRFSDRSALYLPGCGVSLTDALQQLLVAQQQWAQQQQASSSPVQQQTRPRPAVELQQEKTADRADDDIISQPQDAPIVRSSSTDIQGDKNQPERCDEAHIAGPSVQPSQLPATGPAAAAAAAVKAPFRDSRSSMDGAALQSAAQRLFQGASRGCLGVPFSCHSLSALSDARGDLCGLTYCICTHRPGAALALADVLTAMAARLTYEEVQDRPGSLLLLGRPGVGKTRLLRDVCRLMSLPPHQGGLGLHVLLLDTHGRVAGLSCQPSPDVGLTRCLAVHDSTQQAQLMSTAVLQHKPDVLVVHELSTAQDVEAAAHVSHRHNLLLVAGAAAHSLQQLLQDTTLCGLVGCERQAVSCTAGGVANTTSQAQLRADRALPFDTVLELAGVDRWCLCSVTSKLADGAVGLGEQCSSVPTECRSLDAAGRLLAKFESVPAAHRAHTFAHVVSKLAAGAH